MSTQDWKDLKRWLARHAPARSLLIQSMVIVLGVSVIGGAQADAKLNDLVIVIANGRNSTDQ
jgi:hypothetical protein